MLLGAERSSELPRSSTTEQSFEGWAGIGEKGVHCSRGKRQEGSHCYHVGRSALTARAPDPAVCREGQEESVCTERAGLPSEEAGDGHHYFTVYFMTLWKLTPRMHSSSTCGIKKYNKW